MRNSVVRLSSFLINARYLMLLVWIGLTTVAFPEIIPAGRRISWDPGVRGNIPRRAAIFANVKNPPFNAAGDGIVDDTAAIQNALNQCTANQVVFLPEGTYKITAPLTLKDNISLRGAGMGTTIIKGAPGFSDQRLISIRDPLYDYSFQQSSPRNLSGGLAKGSTSITTSSPHGWQTGDYLLIDQLNEPLSDPPISSTGSSGTCTWCSRGNAGDRPLAQWVKVTEVPNSTTASVSPPLHWTYDSSAAPQGVKLNHVRSNAGLEDLTVDNSVSGARDTVALTWAINSWISNVEMIGSYRRMLEVSGGLWNTIRGCMLHEGVPATPIVGAQYGSNRAYGIFLGPWPTACLIENNIFYHLSFGISLEGAPSGNVISYNYFTSFYYNDSDWQRVAIGHHGAHPMMNLIEGNDADGLSIESDNYWGTSSHTTLFRNRVTNTIKPCGPWAVVVAEKVTYWNIVGNILGSPTDNTYELANKTFSLCNGDASARAIYKLGYIGINTGYDPKVSATLVRHGNFDYVTTSVIWDNTISDRSLPPSLYLNAKPDWWGKPPWPAIGPDLNPRDGHIPSKLRYVLQAPQNLHFER